MRAPPSSRCGPTISRRSGGQEVTANPNLIAAVKTHPDAPHRFMIDVLDALQLAGAERISLQILEEF